MRKNITGEKVNTLYPAPVRLYLQYLYCQWRKDGHTDYERGRRYRCPHRDETVPAASHCQQIGQERDLQDIPF